MSDENKRQESVFRDGEGDAWFERNRKGLTGSRSEGDWPIYLLNQMAKDEAAGSILELGCANGWRLEQLRELGIGNRHVGVDISTQAIAAGQTQFKDLELHQSSISDVAITECFDIVIVNFVLHWVDRSLLSRAVAEIDRLVKDGGSLLIGDFYPDSPVKRHYGHLEDKDVFTFKQDYADIFLNLGTYKKISMVSGIAGIRDTKAGLRWSDHQDRTGISLMRKSLLDYYIEQK